MCSVFYHTRALKDQTNQRILAVNAGVDGQKGVLSSDLLVVPGVIDHRPERVRRPVSDVPVARRVRRDAHQSRLLGGVRRPAHRHRRAVAGHGLTFTNGRGTEVCVAAIRALEPLVVGRTLDGITGDMRCFWRSLVSDGQLRWLGPEKGVMHLAAGAVVQRGLGSLGEEQAACRSGSSSPTSRPRSSSSRSTSATSRTSSLRRRRSTSCGTDESGGTSASSSSSRPATRRTRRRPAGSGTTTRRWPLSSARRSPTASGTSR